MTSFFASDSTADLSADSTIEALPHETSRESEQPFVSAVRQSLTADQREAAIKLAGDLVVKYMALACTEGADYFHWRGLADRARLSMEALIKGRDAGWKRTV